MAKRKKNGNKNSGGPVQLAQRFLQRNDYRQALKQARVAVRKSPSDETRRLVELASLGRTDELLLSGHVDQACDLLTPLAKTIEDPKLKSLLPELLLRAGVVDQFPEFRLAISETDRRDFETESFDKAVIDLRHAPAADVREQATLIQRAMEAVESGDDHGALESLRGIPRRSLAADWRYFVRGLIAWYGGDGDTVVANWNRLDPTRAASRIVVQLTADPKRSAANVETAAHESMVAGKAIQLSMFDTDAAHQGESSAEINPFGVRADATLPPSLIHAVPLLRSINDLQQILLKLANEDWVSVSTTFRNCHSVLRQNAPLLLDRIAEKIVARMIHADDEKALEDFCRQVDAPPLDPNWNRARATLSESLWEDDEEDFYTAEQRWLRCLRDIDQIDSFSGVEKQIARSLIETRIGRMHVSEVLDLIKCTCGRNHDDDISAQRERAADFLEHAISSCPACVDPWRELIELHEAVDDPAAVIAVRRRMLVEFPDDLETLLAAAEGELDSGEPLQGRDHLLQALRIKPLDDKLRSQLVMAHRECARMFIRATEFDTARAELDAAAAVDNGNEMYHVNHFALRAILELSAANESTNHDSTSSDSVAGRCMDDAVSAYAEPTAVYLDLAIEAATANLSASITRRFEEAWRAGLGKKCHTQTAGQMARLMNSRVNDDDRKSPDYEAEVTKYIKRTNRVRFTSLDLGNVCVFLQVTKNDELLHKYIKKGRKQFPKEPFFHLLAAQFELNKGPYDCRRKQVFNAFSTVLTICDQSTDSRHQRMAATAREGLSFLSGVGLKKQQKPSVAPKRFGQDAANIPEELRAEIERFANESGLDFEEVIDQVKSEFSSIKS